MSNLILGFLEIGAADLIYKNIITILRKDKCKKFIKQFVRELKMDENIKKVATSLVLLLSTSSLIAQELSCDSMCHSFRGSYVGVGIGPETANFKQKALFIGRAPSADVRVIDTNRFAGKGAFASLFAGFDFGFPMCDPNCDNLYFGIEANANIRNLKHKYTNKEFVNINFNHDYRKMHYDLGISVLPGILFSNCSLLYARLGYSNGKFKVDTTDTSLQNISTSRNGFRYGLGFRQSLSECLSLRLEYSQINYKRFKMFTYDPIGNAAKTTHTTPHIQRFEVGLLFTF